MAFPNWRFGLTQTTLWRIEVAPVPGLSNVATPTKAIITIPISIYRGGDGDRFCGGSHVRQIWDGCHLDPPERQLGKPEAPVEERHTGSFLLLLRFLRSCAWYGCRCTRFSDSRDDLQDTPVHRLLSP